MSDNAKNGQKSSVDNGENKKMEIEITRYKKIVEAFNSPRALAKLIIVISLIIVLVFFGISVIALVVKSYYPYKTVNSNEYGATIIENEDNEVIYWLFNTADLWANSGIHVKEGDVISVRASGAFHSSIHHLVEDAEKNRRGRNWLNPIGGPNASGPREEARASYRISSAQPYNTLLMQVIPENVVLKDPDGNWITEYSGYLDGRSKIETNNDKTINYNKSIFPDIYAIGAERDKITIRTDGVLHFAVNDIALTRDIIMQMKEKVKKGEKKDKFKDIGPLAIGRFPIPDVKDTAIFIRETNVVLKGLRTIGFGVCPSDTLNFVGNFKKDNNCDSLYRELFNKFAKYDRTNTESLMRDYSELDYYLICNFVDAWFVDNAGSYLIVIERKKQ